MIQSVICTNNAIETKLCTCLTVRETLTQGNETNGVHCRRERRQGGGGSLHECAPAAASPPSRPDALATSPDSRRPAIRQPRVPQLTVTESQRLYETFFFTESLRGHGHVLPRGCCGAARAAWHRTSAL